MLAHHAAEWRLAATFTQPQVQPRLLRRLNVFIRHGLRVLVRTWPSYGFDDLAAMQDSFDGPAFALMGQRMLASPEGRDLLVRRPRINSRSVDLRALSRLPEHTLGHQFYKHLTDNGLTEDVVLAPSKLPWDELTEYAKIRYRETHDLRHVLTGLGVELHEEVALQAFQFAQQAQVFSFVVVLFGGLKALASSPRALGDGRARRWLDTIVRAYRAGKRARFLLLVDYENAWECSLEQLRREWRVEAVGERYQSQNS